MLLKIFSIIWLLIFIFNLFIRNFFYTFIQTNNNNLKNRADTAKISINKTFFDGFPLFYKPSKLKPPTINKIQLKKPVNCDSFLVYCQLDDDCSNMCLSINNNNNNNTDSVATTTTTTVTPVCFENVCRYKYHEENKLACQNGGQPIPSFLENFSFECACPPTFIGRRCQIPNLLAPLSQKTFNLNIDEMEFDRKFFYAY